MRALLLSDLALALPHLLGEKAEVLDRTVCGQLYRPYLVALLASIEQLPPPAPGGRPLPEAVEEADLVADTIDLLTELRSAVATELAADPVARHHIDRELFSFIDQLASDREATVRRRAMATTLVLPASIVDGVSPRETTR